MRTASLRPVSRQLLAVRGVTWMLGALLVSVAGPQAALCAGAADTAADIAGATATKNAARLDVALALLDPGIPASEALHRQMGLFPEIREVEARYLPYLLRLALVESQQWGAVRVVPGPDPLSDLLVSGAIVQSDGATLELALRAVDSTGRVWLAKTYAQTITDDNAPLGESDATEPFRHLFEEVAEDLLEARDLLGDRELAAIAEVSLLRYAAEMSPEAFGDYLRRGPSGMLEILRLPARDDPMLQRVLRARASGELLTDTLDQQFEAWYREIGPTYDLWRKYRRQLARETQAGEQKLAQDKSRRSRGSFAAIRQSYDNYRWAKTQDQILAKWATGFNNEVAPTVLELDGRVIELTGSFEARHAEWRKILRSIFELETGIQSGS